MRNHQTSQSWKVSLVCWLVCLSVGSCVALSEAIGVDRWQIRAGASSIERVTAPATSAAHRYILEFYRNGAVFARSFLVSHGVGKEVGWYLEIPSESVKVFVPEHFDDATPLRFVVLNGQRKRVVSLGEEYQVTSEVKIVRAGVVELFGAFLSPAGYLLMANAGGVRGGEWTVIHPLGANSLVARSSDFDHRLSAVRNFLEKTLARKLPTIAGVVTNDRLSAERSSGTSGLRSFTNGCEELPECCCKPEELSADGKCRLTGALVVGGFGAVGEIEQGIVDKMAENPCMKNYTVFTYDNERCAADIAAELAATVEAQREACQSPHANIDAYCYGGSLAALAMDELNSDGSYSINTYSTAWDGTFRMYRVGNWLSFGIIGALMDKPIRDIMNNCVPTPGPVPPNVKFHSYAGGSDHNFSDASQTAGPAGSTFSLDPNTGHYSTIQEHFQYVTCCGDEKVQAEGGEQCDPEGAECVWMAPGNSFTLTGTCDAQCQCQLPGICGNGIVEEGEECDPPGSIAMTFCKTEVLCSSDCKFVDEGAQCPADPQLGVYTPAVVTE